jgi:hypothetical protein
MPNHLPLPAVLAEHPFRYSDAQARGIGEGRLRGPDLERPFHGVRAVRAEVGGPDLSITLQACARFAPLLTADRFFSHETAARRWGCPLPHSPELDRVTVSALAPHNAPRGRGVIGHRSSDAGLRVVTRYGFPVSDPESTWLAMSSLLSPDELIVLADHMILDPYVFDPHDPRPYSTLQLLTERVAGFSGRGARKTAAALKLARVGSESRPETLLRLMLARDGLPEPLLNVDINDARGRLLGRGDLVWPTWRTIAEYDGDHHRTDQRQYDRDIHRIEAFVAADWRVVRVRKRGLFVTTADTIERVRAALSAGGWHPNHSSRPKSI